MPDKMPIANPVVVLREEFDDWAVLFDPDTGDGYAVDPVGAFIWKKLDGSHTAEQIIAELKESCEDVPDEAEEHCRQFIEQLVSQGLAGYELSPGRP